MANKGINDAHHYFSLRQTRSISDLVSGLVVYVEEGAGLLHLYLGWSPSRTSAEVALTLWHGVAQSATSHSRSSAFSDTE